MKRTLLSAVVVCSVPLLGLGAETTIVIDPGPVGTTYHTSQLFDFAELNGTILHGQTISVDFMFPNGVEAVYRYDASSNSRNLYGWIAFFDQAGGTTVNVEPHTLSVVPLDAVGVPVAPSTGIFTAYGDGTCAYYGNYNTLYFSNNLVAFTDVPYHGVRMNLRLPDYVEDYATIVRGRFGFTVNGVGEYTELIPEHTSFFLLGFGSLAFVLMRGKRA